MSTGVGPPSTLAVEGWGGYEEPSCLQLPEFTLGRRVPTGLFKSAPEGTEGKGFKVPRAVRMECDPQLCLFAF